MTEDEIVKVVRGILPEAKLEVRGENCSFELLVVDNSFIGKSVLQRQRPILALFKAPLATGELHALSIKAKTPDEIEKQSGLVQVGL